MRDTSDKIKMDVSRKNEMREKLMSSTAKRTAPRSSTARCTATTGMPWAARASLRAL